MSDELIISGLMRQRDELLKAVEEIAVLGRGWKQEGNPYLLISGARCKRIAETADRIRKEIEDG